MPPDDEQETGLGVSESLRTAILAALRELDACLGSPAPTPRDIHVARRAAKRVRALAKLAPHRLSVLSRQTLRAATKARRSFGGARDADVRKQTLDSLREHLSGDALGSLRRAVEQEKRRAFAAGHSAVSDSVRSLARDWRLCDVSSDDGELAAAAARMYRRARRRMKQSADGGPSDLHRWRTAVVDHEYVSDFIGQFAPDMRQEAASADRLRKLLGDFNDLDMLCAFFRRADTDDVTKDAVRELEEVAAQRRDRLREKALRLGEKTYAARPKKWRKRVTKSFAKESGTQTPLP